MKKIALIDFCGTIANFQTLDPYLELIVAQENPQKFKYLGNNIVKQLCQLLTIGLHILGSKHCVYKEILIKQLQGLKREQLEVYGQEYYEKKIRNNLILPVLKLIRQLKEDDYLVIIASAGSELYINYFAEEYDIDEIVTAKIEFEDDVCTGKLLDNCIGKNKACRIQRLLEKYRDNEIFLIGVSDSRSDLPMMDLCNKKIVVSHGKHQFWITEDMEEILWN